MPCCFLLSKINLKYRKCFQRSITSNWKRKFSSKIEIANGYQPRLIEEIRLKQWSEKAAIETNYNDVDKPKFTMILPPPNVTGSLHLGHALMSTIQDVIARRKRQLGFDVIWIPGTDHAGIATQVVVEKKLLKEKGLTRQELGREAFLKEVLKWKNEKEDHIIENLKKIGCSLSWDKIYFTMDEKQEAAVTEAFVRLFDEGLIIRDKSPVNWSCSLESTISDIEVESMEVEGPTEVFVPGYEKNIIFGQLYDIVYKFVNEEDEITVSTTRPETILGDVAVAVHPTDERYQKFKNKSTFLWHPFRKEEIPLVFDDSVDKGFGTGAVKITPAHDKSDFEIAKRHKLKCVQVFTEQGKISENFSEFRDQPRFIARNKILDAMTRMNLLREIKPHEMILPICSRSKDVVEYMLREQWFLKCRSMAENAMDAVRTGKIKIHPLNFETNWYRWLSDYKDWCISRQLWWGHQIPAYHCSAERKSVWVAAKSQKEAMEKASKQLNNSENITIFRDQDVLDTWFSSSLLPFSVFGWPKRSFQSCYPLDLMETGHDILFFWVARMVMLGQKLTSDIPFRNILLNGIVCDVHGRKMSKSLGNVVTPEQIIYGASLQDLKNDIKKSYITGILSKQEMEKSIKGLDKTFPNGIPECGTDSLRFTLCSHNIKNHFINFDVSECQTNRFFFNKIWQAARYTLGAFEKLKLYPKSITFDNIEFNSTDRWILSRLANTKKLCNLSYDQYNFHQVTAALKTFFYTNFCDVYLETTKPGIKECPEKGKAHCYVLAACLSLGLQIMSPITPFISEELLKYFPSFSQIIDSKFIDNDLEAEINEILNVCTAIRQLKSQNEITRIHEPKVYLFPQNNNAWNLLCKHRDTIKTLAVCNDIYLEKDEAKKLINQFKLVSTASYVCSFAITTNSKFGKNVKTIVLNKKKLEKLQNDLNKLQQSISNEGYKSAASKEVQRKHLNRIKQLESEIDNIKKLNQ